MVMWDAFHSKSICQNQTIAILQLCMCYLTLTLYLSLSPSPRLLPRPKVEPAHMLEEGRRPSKHSLERVKEKPERYSWPDKPIASSVSVPEGFGGEGKEGRGKVERGREERDHRRKREEEWSESRSLDRKRKREIPEGDTTPPPEPKRLRSTDSLGQKEQADHRQRSLEPAASSREEKHPRGVKEGDSGERKRRYEPGGKEPAAKRPRASFSEASSGGHRYSRAEPGSPSARRKNERTRKEKSLEQGQSDSEGSVPEEGEGGKAKKLDWTTISALTTPKPKPVSCSAVQRFSPGAIFARLGVSRSLAGSHLYRDVCSVVSKYLTEENSPSPDPSTPCPQPIPQSLSQALLENPFGDSEFAMTGVSRIRNETENREICYNIGPCRRALTASADFSLRKKLRKASKVGHLQLLICVNTCCLWSYSNVCTVLGPGRRCLLCP